MSFNFGYKQGKKMAAEMAGSGKVAVKGHMRGGPVSKSFPKAPPAPKSPSKDSPVLVQAKRGGAVKMPDTDAAQDRAMIKSMVKPSAIKGMKDGGKWIADATKNKGGLHKSLGIPQGQKIPAKKLSAAAAKPGKVGKQARLAQTLKSFG